MELDQVFVKTRKEDMEQYPEAVEWAKANDAHIEDRGDIFKIVKNYVPEEEIQKRDRVTGLKQNLRDSDYAVIKMCEKFLMGEDITELKEKYKAVIADREAKRAEIDSLSPKATTTDTTATETATETKTE